MGDEKGQREIGTPSAGERLDSWKEIANYLKRAVRTVQRWEKEEGLPIHRHHHQKQGSVYAHRNDLDTWWHQRQAKSQQGKESAGPRSVAVLPLFNVGGNPDDSYLCDGLTEEIIQRLSRVSGLHVSSRTSVFPFKQRPQTPQEIGRRLNVDWLLEGGLRKASGRTLISARLIDVETGFQLWSQTFESPSQSVFEIPEQIADRFIRDLRIQAGSPGPHSSGGRPTDLAVYENYLRGRHYWNERSQAGLEKSVDFFQRAISQDPSYAPALAGLADAYNMLGYYSHRLPREVFAKAAKAARQALVLDSSLAEAHASLAFARMFESRDWLAAESSFRRALRLNPHYATAHYWYGINLGCQGKPFEAIEQVRKAQQLEPVSPVIMTYVAGAYYYARQYGQAIEKCRQTIELEPDFPLAKLILAWSCREDRQTDRAVTTLEELLEAQPAHGDALAALGHLFGFLGRPAEARKQLDRLALLGETAYCSPGQRGLIHLGLGEREEAVRLLSAAAEECYSWLVFAHVDPVFDPLKGLAAWDQLLRQMNLGAVG